MKVLVVTSQSPDFKFYKITYTTPFMSKALINQIY